MVSSTLIFWFVNFCTLPHIYCAHIEKSHVITNASQSGNSLNPRSYVTSPPGCTWFQRGTVIRGLQKVSQWCQWAIDTAVGRHIDDLDYKRIETFEYYFHGNSIELRNNVQHRFASVQYEADRTAEGRFSHQNGRVLFRCDNNMLICRDEHLSRVFSRVNVIFLVCHFSL